MKGTTGRQRRIEYGVEVGDEGGLLWGKTHEGGEFTHEFAKIDEGESARAPIRGRGISIRKTIEGGERSKPGRNKSAKKKGPRRWNTMDFTYAAVKG